MRNPVAAESPQAWSGSALPPLSPARSLPPLGGSARTAHSMQRATAGQDKGVLVGSYRERRYCGIAKRLSPAARSLVSSFPPARLLPAPACSAAARSCRRCGLQAQTPAGGGRKRVITPGLLHRPSPARPAPFRRPASLAWEARDAHPARTTRGSRPSSPPLRPETGGRGTASAVSPGRGLRAPLTWA
ncbi:ras-related protein Rab-34-like [Chroicocephalus ridibundus]|uniref:ras-related protein Rab-34-like n=1 Tax=Chroicocephalus ridibundus TaxID=1192867 RepID=UPI002FDE2A1C